MFTDTPSRGGVGYLSWPPLGRVTAGGAAVLKVLVCRRARLAPFRCISGFGQVPHPIPGPPEDAAAFGRLLFEVARDHLDPEGRRLEWSEGFTGAGWAPS